MRKGKLSYRHTSHGSQQAEGVSEMEDKPFVLSFDHVNGSFSSFKTQDEVEAALLEWARNHDYTDKGYALNDPASTRMMMASSSFNFRRVF
jgi:hypothetical protein